MKRAFLFNRDVLRALAFVNILLHTFLVFHNVLYVRLAPFVERSVLELQPHAHERPREHHGARLGLELLQLVIFVYDGSAFAVLGVDHLYVESIEAFVDRNARGEQPLTQHDDGRSKTQIVDWHILVKEDTNEEEQLER